MPKLGRGDELCSKSKQFTSIKRKIIKGWVYSDDVVMYSLSRFAIKSGRIASQLVRVEESRFPPRHHSTFYISMIHMLLFFMFEPGLIWRHCLEFCYIYLGLFASSLWLYWTVLGIFVVVFGQAFGKGSLFKAVVVFTHGIEDLAWIMMISILFILNMLVSKSCSVTTDLRVLVGLKSSVGLVANILPWYRIRRTSRCRVMTTNKVFSILS